jgi:hypothetical protein
MRMRVLLPESLNNMSYYLYAQNNPIRYDDFFGLMTAAEKADPYYCSNNLVIDTALCEKECKYIKLIICKYKAYLDSLDCVAKQNEP